MTMDEKTRRTAIMKEIIRELHKGVPVIEAKERFEKEIGNVSSSEIAEIEQALINEGLPPDEIKRFCNVHALLFESALQQAVTKETSTSHPVYLFKLENRAIEKLVQSLKDAVEKGKTDSVATQKQTLGKMINELKGVERHYERKEQLLFPFLEKLGFMGPSKVMWGKDNEIRDIFNAAITGLEKVNTKEDLAAFADKHIKPLAEETLGMIFKEENILSPTAIEKLPPADWVEILRESDEVGYVFIKKPAETDVLIKHLEEALTEEATFCDNEVVFPTGALNLPELLSLLNVLPVDLSFVDKEDRVRYFNKGTERIFTRTKAVIGRNVENCHPPQSLDTVKKILTSFKDGTKDTYDFWINMRGKVIYIRFFAVRDKNRNYLGTLEVTQDITNIKTLEGQKRLIDEIA